MRRWFHSQVRPGSPVETGVLLAGHPVHRRIGTTERRASAQSSCWKGISAWVDGPRAYLSHGDLLARPGGRQRLRDEMKTTAARWIHNIRGERFNSLEHWRE
eukprot:5403152-Pyramimonas_sp.AAC.1